MSDGSYQRHRFAGKGALTVLMVWSLAGCGRGPETRYGGNDGKSLNGTGVFAAMVRSRGHEVRSAWLLTDELAEWAEAIVRFSATPGSPSSDESDWYDGWLRSRPRRSLVYVVRDYDAEPEYWKLVLEQLTDPADDARRQEAKSNLERHENWVSRLPSQQSRSPDGREWFAMAPAVEPPVVCKDLSGPFSTGVNAEAAALPLHSSFKLTAGESLLAGNGKVLAMEWETGVDSRVLAIANGSFLLNLPLVNPQRRQLATNVLDWLDEHPSRVAFVEGYDPVGGGQDTPTLFDLVARIDGFRWAAIQLGIFGLIACLARAPRLGRARPEPRSDAERPAAHAEALGALLERSRSPSAARELLATYRRWRFPHTPPPA